MYDGCGCDINKIMDYLKFEAPGGSNLNQDDLCYLGKFHKSGAPLWVWKFKDSYGDTGFVNVELYLDSYLIGYGSTPPEKVPGD